MTIFATLQPLEKVSHYTPLGIRFWDFTRDVAVSAGLQVTIRPPGRLDLTRRAFQTPSGIYAFHNLPGLRHLEASDPDLPAGVHPVNGSPPQSQRFIIEVEDRLRRFLPVSFAVALPHRGIYPTRPLGSPPGDGLPGFFLFSAPSRAILADTAVLRAQLMERLPGGQTRPAAYAVLEALVVEAGTGLPPVGGAPAIGIADENGSVLAAFPYPNFATSVTAISSPPGPPETRFRAWDLIVRVRYDPASHLRLDNVARLPDLGAILTQPHTRLLATTLGASQSQLNTRLVFGQPLLIQTAGRSDLWIEP